MFQKKAKITILFFMKNSKNKNIILGFSFMYLVSVYPTNRTKQNLLQKARQNLRAYKICGLWVCWQLHADWKIDLQCDDLLCSMNHKKHPFSCIIASFSSPPFFLDEVQCHCIVAMLFRKIRDELWKIYGGKNTRQLIKSYLKAHSALRLFV